MRPIESAQLTRWDPFSVQDQRDRFLLLIPFRADQNIKQYK